MKVLFLRSNPVDPDSRVEKEVESLLKNGIEAEIFCWDRSKNHKVIKEEKKIGNVKCPIYRAGFQSIYGAGFKKNFGPLVKFQNAIVQFIKINHYKYDVIHACDFDTAFSAFRLARKYRIKFIYDIFDYYADAFNVPKALKNIVINFDTNIINKSDAVIICSEKRKKQLREARPKRLIVIHNSPKTINWRKNEENKSGFLSIAYVGILNDGRMIPEMLDIVSKNKKYKLLIGGFGKYESLVKKYALANENIIFYGKVPYEKTIRIESESDVLTALYDPAIPNHQYAAPNKFYEALMLGKPLIMCKNTGMSEVIEKNKFGILIDFDRKGLEKGFKEVYSNIDSFKKKQNEEKKLFDEKYSWNIMEKRLLKLYREIGKDL